ncbi:MAG: DUF1330 domain-containing protein [Gemmatimonadota bacterium]|nr:DUF1330 domain-containing protein [Gemmatimonadota bacterium]
MPVYVIVDISIEDATAYERYKLLAPATLAIYGGKYLVRGGETTVLEGYWNPKRLVILEFASADDAKRWWSSPEYAAAKALRQSCTRTNMLIIDGPSFNPATM